jgi:hypothetical protein
MYFLMYNGKPNPDENKANEIGGAYINCYILAESLTMADKKARRDIKTMKWIISNREDAYEIDAESISENGKSYYNQALIDGKVYVFHTYPPK